MKKSVSIIFIVTLCILNPIIIFGQGSGFFSMKNGKIYDPSGNEFYPLVCNYSCVLSCEPNIDPAVTHPNLNQFYICPIIYYGPTNDYDCNNSNDCINIDIHNDFVKIRDMGFNTIRLNGINYYQNCGAPPGGVFHYGWDANAVICPNDAQHPGASRDFQITPPYDDPNGVAYYMFDLVKQVIDEAEECSLAVILDETDNGFTRIKTNDWTSYTPEYIKYAKAKVDYFKSMRNILAYVFIEEPENYNFSLLSD